MHTVHARRERKTTQTIRQAREKESKQTNKQTNMTQRKDDKITLVSWNPTFLTKEK